MTGNARVRLQRTLCVILSLELSDIEEWKVLFLVFSVVYS